MQSPLSEYFSLSLAGLDLQGQAGKTSRRSRSSGRRSVSSPPKLAPQDVAASCQSLAAKFEMEVASQSPPTSEEAHQVRSADAATGNRLEKAGHGYSPQGATIQGLLGDTSATMSVDLQTATTMEAAMDTFVEKMRASTELEDEEVFGMVINAPLSIDLEPQIIKLHPEKAKRALARALDTANVYEGTGWQRLGAAIQTFFACGLPKDTIAIFQVGACVDAASPALLTVYVKVGNTAWLLMKAVNGTRRLKMIHPQQPPAAFRQPPAAVLQDALNKESSLIISGGYSASEIWQLQQVAAGMELAATPAPPAFAAAMSAFPGAKDLQQVLASAQNLNGSLIEAVHLSGTLGPLLNEAPRDVAIQACHAFLAISAEQVTTPKVASWLERASLSLTPIEAEVFFDHAYQAAANHAHACRALRKAMDKDVHQDADGLPAFVQHFRDAAQRRVQENLVQCGVAVFNDIRGAFLTKHRAT